jgi:hypothetical protein
MLRRFALCAMHYAIFVLNPEPGTFYSLLTPETFVYLTPET